MDSMVLPLIEVGKLLFENTQLQTRLNNGSLAEKQK